MNKLYEKIFYLCESRGIKPGKMCKDLGISRGNISDLKMGRIESLSIENLSKIASYFSVSVDDLLDAEGKKKSLFPEGKENEVPMRVMGYGLSGSQEVDKLSEEEYFALKAMLKAMRQQQKERDKNK